METERALQQLELLQKKLYAYHCADSSLYLDAVTTADVYKRQKVTHGMSRSRVRATISRIRPGR